MPTFLVQTSAEILAVLGVFLYGYTLLVAASPAFTREIFDRRRWLAYILVVFGMGGVATLMVFGGGALARLR